MSYKLEYSVAKNYNVGDDLNLWLWPRLLGDFLGESQDKYFLGIGTVLTKDRINSQLKHAKEIVIFSSGAWGEKSCPTLTDNCKVYGVRGPRTAKLLGLSEDLVIGDGAYLLTQVDYPKAEKVKGRVGFIPHHKSEEYIDWPVICEKAGLVFISAKQPVDDFLIALQQCESVISEAMHGAIIADALRVPWVGVSYSPLFEEEKWLDFSEALGIPLEIKKLPFITSKKFKFFKNINNSLKKTISTRLKINKKWGNRPVLWKKATLEEFGLLKSELVKIKNSEFRQLSEDDNLYSIIDMQLAALKKISIDYNVRS